MYGIWVNIEPKLGVVEATKLYKIEKPVEPPNIRIL